jgi:4-amino-4-deoxy-L-arabinose transferase-like glycosyltransferase
MRLEQQVTVRQRYAETGLILVLGIVTWLSRLPFHPRWLDSYDAVNYVLAVRHFDVRLHQTQPPGYFLYIVGVRVVNLLVGDPARALFLFSGLASGIAVIAMYLAGREMLGRRAGLAAAILLGTSSIFWYQSEIASPYTGEVALSVFIGWLAYRARKSGRTTDLLLTALLLGISGAYRPQTLVFLAPLLLYALWARSWKLWIISGLIVAVSAGVLFWPAIEGSGGLSEYQEAVFDLKGDVVTGHQVRYGSRRYLGYVITTLKNTGLAVGELGIVLVLLGVVRQLIRRQVNLLLFLALWLVPAWMVFFLLYPGNIGTILVCTPPFFLLAGSSFEALPAMRGRRVQVLALVAVTGWHIILFAWLPRFPLGERYRAVHNASTIRWVDAYVEDLLALVDEFPVEGTLVMVHSNWRHLQYYRSEYMTYSRVYYSPDRPDEIRYILEFHRGRQRKLHHVAAEDLVPLGTQRILLLETPPERLSASAPWLQEHSRHGISVFSMATPADQQAIWTPDGVVLVSRQ